MPGLSVPQMSSSWNAQGRRQVKIIMSNYEGVIILTPFLQIGSREGRTSKIQTNNRFSLFSEPNCNQKNIIRWYIIIAI